MSSLSRSAFDAVFVLVANVVASKQKVRSEAGEIIGMEGTSKRREHGLADPMMARRGLDKVPLYEHQSETRLGYRQAIRDMNPDREGPVGPVRRKVSDPVAMAREIKAKGRECGADLPMAHDSPMSFGVLERCMTCQACINNCPGGLHTERIPGGSRRQAVVHRRGKMLSLFAASHGILSPLCRCLPLSRAQPSGRLHDLHEGPKSGRLQDAEGGRRRMNNRKRKGNPPCW